MCSAKRRVCFTPESGNGARRPPLRPPLRAVSLHRREHPLFRVPWEESHGPWLIGFADRWRAAYYRSSISFVALRILARAHQKPPSIFAEDLCPFPYSRFNVIALRQANYYLAADYGRSFAKALQGATRGAAEAWTWARSSGARFRPSRRPTDDADTLSKAFRRLVASAKVTPITGCDIPTLVIYSWKACTLKSLARGQGTLT
jgi:hypothetical protein